MYKDRVNVAYVVIYALVNRNTGVVVVANNLDGVSEIGCFHIFGFL